MLFRDGFVCCCNDSAITRAARSSVSTTLCCWEGKDEGVACCGNGAQNGRLVAPPVAKASAGSGLEYATRCGAELDGAVGTESDSLYGTPAASGLHGNELPIGSWAASVEEEALATRWFAGTLLPYDSWFCALIDSSSSRRVSFSISLSRSLLFCWSMMMIMMMLSVPNMHGHNQDVCCFRTNSPGDCIGCRADEDSLLIFERKGTVRSRAVCRSERLEMRERNNNKVRER